MPDIRQSGVLDDCQRPNESPLSHGGRWSPAAVGSFWNTQGVGLQLFQNHIQNPVASGNATNVYYWNETIFAQQAEVWARAGAGIDLSEGWRMHIMLQSPSDGLAFSGYELRIINISNIWELRRHDEFNIVTGLGGTTSGMLAENELALMRYDSGEITVWRDNVTNGASWSLLFTATDSTYQFGYIAIGTDQDDPNPSWREFGGGQIRRTQIYRYVSN